MTKLPVFKAIGATLAFILQHGLAVLKIAWLPAVLMCGIYLLIMPPYMNQIAAMPMDQMAPQQTMSRMLATLPMMGLLMAASVLVNLVLISGLMKLLIRGEQPRLPFYLSFSADEARLLGGWAVVFLGYCTIGLAFGASLVLSQVLASLGPGPGGIIGLVAAAVLAGVGVWFGIRVCLVSPATIELEKIAIRPAWEITEENVWRLVGFWLLLVVPMLIVASLLTPLLTAPGYLEAMSEVYAAARSPTRMQQALHHAYEVQAAGYNLSDGGNVVRLCANALLGVVASVILAIANGVAWRLMRESAEQA
ncbi:MAG: hypothetical protein GC155_05930 [Alphaproteobacteria bacterium]|nr:hypothetical protein [Alphaproteobacteria bacterium]